MSGWGQYNQSAYGQQQGGQQQAYSAQGQQQADAYGGYRSNQGAGYAGAQGAGQSGHGANQHAAGAAQPSYGGQQSAAYGHNQQGAQVGAVAQAAQGLAPDQQARVSQIVAQMGGSGGQQGYGSSSYQQLSAAGQYAADAPQSAYGAAQPAAQSYTPSQTYAQQSPATAQQGYGTIAQQGYGTTAQQGYGSTVQNSQGYGSSSYGTPQQGATAAYGQQQQAPQTQPTPTPFTAQAGYQASQGSVPSSGAYGPQTAAAYGTQATVTPQGYGSQISQAPYAMQQAAYGQQAPRTSMAAAQPGAMQQPAYGQQATAKSSYQASYGGQSGSLAQYGAPQYGNQQAAAATPAPITLPARPAAQAGTFSTTSYNRPSAQSRPAATPAAAVPAFGRPTVQAPAGNRAAMRPAKGAAAATPAVPAAPAGRPGAAFAKPVANNSRGGRQAPNPGVGQSAREIARIAESLRDKKDDARGRERTREQEKGDAKEHVSVVPPRGTASKDRDRDRDREPVRLRKPAPAPKKASPPRRREPDYLVRLSTRPVTIQDRDYNDVIDRYPRLYVSADFAKSISSWVQANKVTKEKTLWPLHEPVTFQHEMDFEMADIPAPVAQSAGIKWNARVMLLQGLDDAARKEWVKGTHHGGQHLHHLLKFLTVRHEVDNSAKGRTERSGIMAVGGSYDPALDGGLEETAGTPKALINTCIRHAHTNLGIDLSSCSQWMRFLEVHYQRPASSMKPPAMETSEVTVVFMVNVKTLFDKDWTPVWEEQQAWLKRRKEHDHAERKKAKEEEEARAKVRAEKEAKDKAEKEAREAKEKDKAFPIEDAPPAPPVTPKDRPEPASPNGPAKGEEEGMDEPTPKRAKKEDSKEDAKPNSATAAKPAEKVAAGDEANKTDAGEEEKDADKEETIMPETPRLLITGKKSATDRWRSASVSLDGLLDYDEEDRDEPTLELSLFAEAFQEMLVRDYGTQILNALYVEREAALRRREERKRKREKEEKAAAEKAAAEKAVAEKGAIETKEEVNAPVKEEPAAQPGGDKAEEAKQEAEKLEVKEESSKEAAAADKVPNGEAAAPVVDKKEAAEEAAGPSETPDKAPEAESPEEPPAKGAKKKGAARGRGRGRGRGGRSAKGKAKTTAAAEEAEDTAENAATPEEKAAKPEEPTDMELDKPAEEAKATKAAEKGKEEKGTVSTDSADKAADTGAAAMDTTEDAPPPPATDAPAKDDKSEKEDAMDEKSEKEADKAKEKDDKAKEKEKEKKKKYKVNEDLLQAFRYFDKNCTGYLRVDDLRRIINNLSLALSLRTVKELCLNVAGGSSTTKLRADRVYYRDITDTEIKDDLRK